MKNESRVKKIENRVKPDDTEADRELADRIIKTFRSFLQTVNSQIDNEGKRYLPVEEDSQLVQKAWEVAKYKQEGSFPCKFGDREELEKWKKVYDDENAVLFVELLGDD